MDSNLVVGIQAISFEWTAEHQPSSICQILVVCGSAGKYGMTAEIMRVEKKPFWRAVMSVTFID